MKEEGLYVYIYICIYICIYIHTLYIYIFSHQVIATATGNVPWTSQSNEAATHKHTEAVTESLCLLHAADDGGQCMCYVLLWVVNNALRVMQYVVCCIDEAATCAAGWRHELREWWGSTVRGLSEQTVLL